MIKSDYHVHSSFSTDSEAPLDDIINKSISIGFERICITDHMDREYPSEEYPFEIDLPEYAAAINDAREKYKNKIKVLFGIELGLRNEPDTKLRIKSYYDELLSKYNFDFIIGSTHVLFNEDPYNKSFWDNRTSRQTLNDYFQSIIDNVNYYNYFNVYGHLDYIVRYIPEKEKDYIFNEYSDLIDIMLKTIISRGIGIELNTSGYRYGLPNPHPKKELLTRYLELGGEIITIGSDAHKLKDIAYGFKRTEELLTSLGYRYYTVFEGQRAIFIKF